MYKIEPQSYEVKEFHAGQASAGKQRSFDHAARLTIVVRHFGKIDAAPERLAANGRLALEHLGAVTGIGRFSVLALWRHVRQSLLLLRRSLANNLEEPRPSCSLKPLPAANAKASGVKLKVVAYWPRVTTLAAITPRSSLTLSTVTALP